MTLPGRSLDWFRQLDRAAHATDDWGGVAEPAPGRPDIDLDLDDPHRSDTERFRALSAVALPLALMAHRTPAWIERHVAIIDRLLERHLTWWSFTDRLRAAGTDRARLDPVAAAPYTASLLLLLGVRSALTPDLRWNHPFEIVGNGSNGFVWAHGRVVEEIARRWPELAADPDVAPETMIALGLGLRLHDVRAGTDLHRAFRSWWDDAGPVLRDGAWPLPAVIDAALHLAPQLPDDARTLFEAALTSPGFDLAELDDATLGAALLLVREWGLSLPGTPAAQLEERFLVAGADVGGPDRLAALGRAVVDGGPNVVDVDAPALVLSRAQWSNGSLILELDVEQPDPRVWTMFRIAGAEPRLWYLTGIDRATMDVTSSAVIVRVPLVSGPLEFTPGSY